MQRQVSRQDTRYLYLLSGYVAIALFPDLPQFHDSIIDTTLEM